MQNLIFFIFIFSCISNKENFDRDSAKKESTQPSEELLANESQEAVENDNVSKLEKLFSKGLRINRNYNGKTLLFRAVENDKKECIKYLLSQGAIISEEFDKSDLKDKKIELEVKDSKWQISSLLDTLLKSNTTFKKLKEEQKKLADNIFIKLDFTKEEQQYILDRISAGANINERVKETGVYECSSLHALANKGTESILKEFLKRYEGDINEVDNEGRTVLSRALEGNIVFSKALLESGIDPNIHESKYLNYAPAVYVIHNWTIHSDIEFLESLVQKTSREDILGEALKVLQSDKFKSNLEHSIKELNFNKEYSNSQEETNIKIKKMITLKDNLEKNCPKNFNAKNILLIRQLFSSFF